jgi:hypothetical protein
MPELLTDPVHWHLRAQEARRRAQKMRTRKLRHFKARWRINTKILPLVQKSG